MPVKRKPPRKAPSKDTEFERLLKAAAGRMAKPSASGAAPAQKRGSAAA
jgi:hypothetical protein